MRQRAHCDELVEDEQRAASLHVLVGVQRLAQAGVQRALPAGHEPAAADESECMRWRCSTSEDLHLSRCTQPLLKGKRLAQAGLQHALPAGHKLQCHGSCEAKLLGAGCLRALGTLACTASQTGLCSISYAPVCTRCKLRRALSACRQGNVLRASATLVQAHLQHLSDCSRKVLKQGRT